MSRRSTELPTIFRCTKDGCDWWSSQKQQRSCRLRSDGSAFHLVYHRSAMISLLTCYGFLKMRKRKSKRDKILKKKGSIEEEALEVVWKDAVVYGVHTFLTLKNFSEMSMEKINGKCTTRTGAVLTVGCHCYTLYLFSQFPLTNTNVVLNAAPGEVGLVTATNMAKGWNE